MDWRIARALRLRSRRFWLVLIAQEEPIDVTDSRGRGCSRMRTSSLNPEAFLETQNQRLILMVPIV